MKTLEFREIIRRIIKITGWLQKDIATEIYDITDKNLSGRITDNRIPLKRTIFWAIQNNHDLVWLLTGNKAQNQTINTAGLNRQEIELVANVAYILNSRHPRIAPALEQNIKTFYWALREDEEKTAQAGPTLKPDPESTDSVLKKYQNPPKKAANGKNHQ